jgi:ABC-type multidrug transport system fused ATPase/permease subunit
MLAYDYPVLGAFWTLLWIVLWVIWLFLLFRVIFDIFRDHDLSGWSKALWLIFVIVLPFLGVFVYIIARGREMGERDMREAKARQESFDAYVRDAAGSAAGGGTADELTKLADLRERGVITDAEFEQQKAKLLA